MDVPADFAPASLGKSARARLQKKLPSVHLLVSKISRKSYQNGNFKSGLIFKISFLNKS